MPGVRLVRAEVDAADAGRLRYEDAGDALSRGGELRGDACDVLEVVAQRHRLIVDSVP